MASRPNLIYTLKAIFGDSANVLRIQEDARLAETFSAVRTSAQILSATNSINTTGKFLGRQVYDTTLGKPLWSDGTGATSTWSDATGTAVHTPS